MEEEWADGLASGGSAALKGQRMQVGTAQRRGVSLRLLGGVRFMDSLQRR